MAWARLMGQAPPLSDTADYRRIFYEWVFNGVMAEPKKTTPTSRGGRRAPTPPSAAQRRQLAEQVAADRDDPRKAALRAEALQRTAARREAARAQVEAKG